jgi:hypothetical protein
LDVEGGRGRENSILHDEHLSLLLQNEKAVRVAWRADSVERRGQTCRDWVEMNGYISGLDGGQDILLRFRPQTKSQHAGGNKQKTVCSHGNQASGLPSIVEEQNGNSSVTVKFPDTQGNSDGACVARFP